MGQPIVVVQKPTSKNGALRFEINRSLTGMAHEHYRSVKDATGDRPPDVLARRLFQAGGVSRVHVFSNIIDVVADAGVRGDDLVPIIRDLYIHYREGVTPSVT